MLASLTHHAAQLLLDIVRLTVWLGLLAAVFVPLERLLTASVERPSRASLRGDLVYYFVNSLVPGMLMALPVAVMARAGQALLPHAYLAAVATLPFWLLVVIAVVAGEVGVYWAHRLCHRIPMLWRFHAVHHAPEHMNWLVNTRAHPVDVVFTRICGLAPIYLLGLQAAGDVGAALLPMLVSLIGTVWSFAVHANVRLRFGKLEYVIATPGFHHWHHTNDGNINKNFAALLPVLDAVFGTLYLPKQFPPCYGISEDHPATVSAELIGPFRPRPAAAAATPDASAQAEPRPVASGPIGAT